eukprot:1258255-Rhodomonas_salina.4
MRPFLYHLYPPISVPDTVQRVAGSVQREIKLTLPGPQYKETFLEKECLFASDSQGWVGATFPPSITRILSAFVTVLRRCAIKIVVCPFRS